MTTSTVRKNCLDVFNSRRRAKEWQFIGYELHFRVFRRGARGAGDDVVASDLLARRLFLTPKQLIGFAESYVLWVVQT